MGTYETVPDIFADNAGTFVAPAGPDLLGRVRPFRDWIDARKALAVYPYERTNLGGVGPDGVFDDGVSRATFGFQDYLNLSRHPRIVEAAVDAVRRFGPHSAGAPFWQGLGPLTESTCGLLAELVGMEHVVLFPTGWAAGFGTIQALVRPYDHVVFDRLSHASLQTGMQVVTGNLHPFPHNDLDVVAATLRRIRAEDTEGAILVVTESLFSLDSDFADLRQLQGLCREHQATLLVDAAHDMGCMGPGGTGQIGAQGMRGRIDLVCGSFSKVFGFIGGYLATNSAEVANHVRLMASPYLFSNAISPVALAVVAESLRIVRSEEGDQRRAGLMRNILRFRAGLNARGLAPMGVPSPIVPVPAPDVETGARAAVELLREGVSANLVEFPAVKLGTARLRFQMMAEHTPEQIDLAAEACGRALAAEVPVPETIDLRERAAGSAGRGADRAGRRGFLASVPDDAPGGIPTVI